MCIQNNYLLMNAGCLLILIASLDYPGFMNITYHFWLHEHGWPMKLSDSITESLNTLGIKYKTESIYTALDCTDSFRDEFQKPRQKNFLDFLVHVKLERYPPEISQLCIEYLDSVAIGKPKQYLLQCSLDFIVYKNE